MTEIEFVNREFAEAEARRAIVLLNQSDESKVEAWFALQSVADQIGPESNVGVRGVSWSAPARPGRKGNYRLSARCRDGLARSNTGAPSTLEEARAEPAISNAIKLLNRLIEENGGDVSRGKRPTGSIDAIVAAVSASPEGSAWLAQVSHGRHALAQMVRVADVYGRDGVYAPASLGAHTTFISFDNRAELIRQYPTQLQARAKAMSLRNSEHGSTQTPDAPSIPLDSRSHGRVSHMAVVKLSARSGVTTKEARTILYAIIDGRSKAKLIRAVNEAIKMVETDGQRLKVAA